MVWELKFIVFLQEHGSKFLDFLWSSVSMFGEEIFMILIIGLIYWCFNKKMGETITYTLLASASLNGIVKNIVVRPRPCNPDAYGEWNIVNKKSSSSTGYSFPSGHSQNSATIFTSLSIQIRRKWMIAVAIVIPLLVAFSRLYLGVHFPTDVIAGLAFGVGMSFLCAYLHRKIENKFLLYGATALVMSFGLFWVIFSNITEYEMTKDYFVAYGMLLGAMGGFLFEHKYVNFDNDVVWWKKLIRLAGGLVVVLAFKEGLKLLFGLIADEGTLGLCLLDLVRYAIMTFAAIGIYPMLFKKFKF